MRFLRSTMIGIAAIGIAVLACQLAYAQTKAIKNPDSSTTIIKRSPKVLAPQRATPGLTNKQYQSGGTALPRKHCNGTCACTGSDCTDDWKKANCKGDITCSGGPYGGSGSVCSCVKKVTN